MSDDILAPEIYYTLLYFTLLKHKSKTKASEVEHA
jgi:hypothetical protein